MPAGTYILQDDEARLINEYREVLQHGYGTVTITVGEIKHEYKTKVTMFFSKSYVFFKEKQVPNFDKKGII